jgi:hypothetical protein
MKEIKFDTKKYKLTEAELDRMTLRGLLSFKQRDLLVETSKLRLPNTPAQQRFQMALHWRGTVMLNSINTNGGDKFNEPYHFVAEITHTLTPRFFKKFMEFNGIPVHPFNS